MKNFTLKCNNDNPCLTLHIKEFSLKALCKTHGCFRHLREDTEEEMEGRLGFSIRVNVSAY